MQTLLAFDANTYQSEPFQLPSEVEKPDGLKMIYVNKGCLDRRTHVKAEFINCTSILLCSSSRKKSTYVDILHVNHDTCK